jgi:hypothetical protein
MVATRKYGENYDMGLRQGRLDFYLTRRRR